MAYVRDEVDGNGMLLHQNAQTLDQVRYGSGFSHIFLHNSKLGYVSPDHCYRNVLVCCPLWQRNQWHSLLAVTRDEPNRVVSNSNSFYWEDRKGLKHQNRHHRIHDRMVFNYHRMRNYPVDKHVIVNEESFLLANAFSGVNSGHDLSAIFDVIQYIKTHPTIRRIIILQASRWFPNNLLLLKALLGPEHTAKLMELEWNKVYRFANIHILRQNIIGIARHPSVINELKRHVLRETASTPPIPQNASVVLLKTHRDKNVVTKTNQLICEKLLTNLERAGWIVINPESWNIFRLCAVLMQAKTILFSHGSILYTHMVFFNPQAQLRWIAVGKEQLSEVYRHVKTPRLQVHRVISRDLDSTAAHIAVLKWLNQPAPANPPTPANPITAIQPASKTIKRPRVVPPAPVSVVVPAPAGVSNSGLLQEHFFYHAVKELVNSAKPGLAYRVGVDHARAQCHVVFATSSVKVVKRTFGVMFPMERITLIKQYWKPYAQRTLRYFFRGMVTGLPHKRWVLAYANESKSEVAHSSRGRGKHKYEFDADYYRSMCNAAFVLTPTDVYPWSYRFLEAIICQCIPILDANEQDMHAIAGGFHFYRTNEEHVWREDWVQDNWQKLLKLHTLSENQELRTALQSL